MSSSTVAGESSVSPKGQVTIPLEIRKKLALKPRDRVAFILDGDEIRVIPVGSILDTIFGSIPPLGRKLSDEEAIRLAAEEHALHVAQEGTQPE